jgi:hypothetical protein
LSDFYKTPDPGPAIIWINSIAKGENQMEDRILTQHPENKQGTRISRNKYEQMCTAIEQSLQEQNPLGFKALNEAVHQKLDGNFDGSIGWYFTTVKLDLEARGVVVCERKSGQPQMIHWARN